MIEYMVVATKIKMNRGVQAKRDTFIYLILFKVNIGVVNDLKGCC